MGHGVGHAPEYPTSSLHAFVADHDEICTFLLGDLDDGFGWTAGRGVNLHLKTSVLSNLGEAVEERVGGMNGRRVLQFGGKMVEMHGLRVVGRHDVDLSSGQPGHVGGDNNGLPGCLRVVGTHQDCLEHGPTPFSGAG